MQDNYLELTPITDNRYSILKNNAYVYANDETALLHMSGNEIRENLPIGCRVEVTYMHPNHLFITPTNDTTGRSLKICGGGKSRRNNQICVCIRKIAKDFKFKPQDPKLEGAQSSGVFKSITPYLYNGITGWLVNIEEFQPEIPKELC
jgi:hypothetical protein